VLRLVTTLNSSRALIDRQNNDIVFRGAKHLGPMMILSKMRSKEQVFLNNARKCFQDAMETPLGKNAFEEILKIWEQSSKISVKISVNDAISIAKKTQIIVVEQATFFGMVGVSNSFYIDFGIIDSQNMAHFVGVCFHEFSHLLYRMLSQNYLKLTPETAPILLKMKVPEALDLEGGLLMEQFLWGKYDADYYGDQEQAEKVTDLKCWERKEGLFSDIPKNKLKLRTLMNPHCSGLCTEMVKILYSSTKREM